MNSVVAPKPTIVGAVTETPDYSDEEESGKNQLTLPGAGMPEKREIVDMILFSEDNMNQLIYADK